MTPWTSPRSASNRLSQDLCRAGKRALDDVSFDVPRGQIFGLLGPNGAGKSTLINILAGLVMKTGGTVKIWGFDIDQHPRNAKRSIGVVPQEIIFDPFFTPRETLEIQAGLYGIPPAERQSDALLAAMHLTDKADAYSRTLSGGMKRRLLVAKAMVHSPPILVLDEPTAGVDVELRRQLWDYVRRLNAQGVTIVLTTHYLEEAEQLCDRIAIIHHGRVIANEPTRELVVQGAGESGRRDLRPRHRRGADQRLLREHRADRRADARDHLSQGQGECRQVLGALAAEGSASSTFRRATPTLRTYSSA